MLRQQVCVDANIIVALVTSEVQSGNALALWTKWMSEDFRVVAPSLLRYEVTSALRRKVARGILSADDAQRALEEALALDIEFPDPPDLSFHAFEIASRFNRPTAYDAYYLALAESLGCEFWTADKALFNAVRDGFANIRWIGDFRVN
jgi:predicted nucleic acid-binding protein